MAKYHTLGSIITKTTDYKICLSCNAINWYENGECVNCQCVEFGPSGSNVKKFANQDYIFYRKDLHYTVAEAYDVDIEV